ncbi:hypothetical protein BESB_014590 [Besnoitia besnoiti]|uniref:Uncharacterized protein n=1 Tax=Besnoitia besnoiti TaxID=94643 RepID=A0A2A9MA85_BESBE|nr:hypothetical protein BESB_014590 [Besnoitia besnoiti]PFH32846.1 hypothetical protein BESB_014590 [Besnoitia besnoiti]
MAVASVSVSLAGWPRGGERGSRRAPGRRSHAAEHRGLVSSLSAGHPPETTHGGLVQLERRGDGSSPSPSAGLSRLSKFVFPWKKDLRSGHADPSHHSDASEGAESPPGRASSPCSSASPPHAAATNRRERERAVKALSAAAEERRKSMATRRKQSRERILWYAEKQARAAATRLSRQDGEQPPGRGTEQTDPQGPAAGAERASGAANRPPEDRQFGGVLAAPRNTAHDRQVDRFETAMISRSTPAEGRAGKAALWTPLAASWASSEALHLRQNTHAVLPPLVCVSSAAPALVSAH